MVLGGSWKIFGIRNTEELNPEFLEQSQRYLMQVAYRKCPGQAQVDGSHSKKMVFKLGPTCCKLFVKYIYIYIVYIQFKRIYIYIFI